MCYLWKKLRPPSPLLPKKLYWDSACNRFFEQKSINCCNYFNSPSKRLPFLGCFCGLASSLMSKLQHLFMAQALKWSSINSSKGAEKRALVTWSYIAMQVINSKHKLSKSKRYPLDLNFFLLYICNLSFFVFLGFL